MRRSIELGILLISVFLALSIFVALAENQTAKDKLNETKLNATNGTTNITAENTAANTNQTNKNNTTNNTANKTNPFANVKGKQPAGT